MNDLDLPGLLTTADFEDGDPDPRSYAERGIDVDHERPVVHDAQQCDWRNILDVARADHEAKKVMWLAAHRTHWSQPNDELIVHHSRYRDDVIAARLKAAEDAVDGADYE